MGTCIALEKYTADYVIFTTPFYKNFSFKMVRPPFHGLSPICYYTCQIMTISFQMALQNVFCNTIKFFHVCKEGR